LLLEKICCGGEGFLLGVLGILVCFVVVKRGEFVVDCGANMDK
jgi:hypothetical protein